MLRKISFLFLVMFVISVDYGFASNLLKYLPGYQDNIIYGSVNLKKLIQNEMITNAIISASQVKGNFSEASRKVFENTGVDIEQLNGIVFFVKQHVDSSQPAGFSSRKSDAGLIIHGKFNPDILFKGAKFVEQDKIKTYEMGPMNATMIKDTALIISTTPKAMVEILDRFRKKGNPLPKEISDLLTSGENSYFVKVFANINSAPMFQHLHPAFALIGQSGGLGPALPKNILASLLHDGSHLKLDFKMLTSYTEDLFQVVVALNTENKLVQMLKAFAGPEKIAELSNVFMTNFKTAKTKARGKACQANMRLLEGSLEMYDMDTPPPGGMTSVITAQGENVKTYPLAEKGYLKTWPDCPDQPGTAYVVKREADGGKYMYVECPVHGTVKNYIDK